MKTLFLSVSSDFFDGIKLVYFWIISSNYFFYSLNLPPSLIVSWPKSIVEGRGFVFLIPSKVIVTPSTSVIASEIGIYEI